MIGAEGNGHTRGSEVTYGARTRESRSLGTLVKELTGETSALLRAEMALARTEIGDKVDQAQRGVTSIATGGVVLFAGVLALCACAILVLSQYLEPWVAALIVGAVVSIIGLALVMKGKRSVSAKNLVPERTIGSVEQMGRTIKGDDRRHDDRREERV